MSYFYNGMVAGQMDMNNDRGNCHKSHKSDQRNTCINENFVDSLVGKCVKINRGGPNSIEGKLIAVKSDYYVVKTKKGITYVAAAHVKSITETNGKQHDCNKDGHKSGNKSGNKSGHKSDHNCCCHKSGKTRHDFINARNFRGVLRALNQTFVQVNWGGPEKVEGFLAQVCNDNILVISGNDALLIPIDHIQSIKPAGHGSRGNRSGGNKSGGNQTGNNNNNKSGNKNNNKSGGRNNTQSQSSRSGNKNQTNAAGSSKKS